MTVRRSLPLPSLSKLPAVLLLVALLSALLMVVSAPAHSAPKPRNDFAKLPRACVNPKDQIPQKPTICHLNTFKDNRATVVVWGDSHAWMMIPAVRRAATNQDVNLVAVVMGGCPAMDNQLQPDEAAPNCYKSNDLAIRFVRELEAGGQGLRVIIGGSWQRYLHAIKVKDQSYTGLMARAMLKATPRLMRTLGGMGVAVDVVGQVATVPETMTGCPAGNDPYSCDVPYKKSMPEKAATKKWLVRTIAPLAGSRAPIDVTPFFCTAKVCHGKVGKTHTWFDDLHVSASMAQRLRGYFKPSVQAAIADRPTVPEPEEPGCTVPILGISC